MLLNAPMLLGSTLSSVSFGFLFPDLYIEPTVSLLKRPSSMHPYLFDYINEHGHNIDIAVIGSPGSGKTTSFQNIILKSEISSALYLSSKDILEIESEVPLIKSILKKKYDMDIDINESTYVGNTIFIDGVDEIGRDGLGRLFAFLIKLQTHSIHFCVSIRSDFFMRYIVNDSKRYSLFSEVLELTDWTPEQGLKFINDFSAKSGKSYITENVSKLLERNENYQHFLVRPFKASMLLFLLYDSSYDMGRISDNDFVLYHEFYDQWVSQEIGKTKSDSCYKEILSIHMKIACELYINKSSCRLSQILNNETIGSSNATYNSVMLGLLVYKYKFSDIIIEKFQHETLAEFLVAYRILDVLSTGNTENIMSIMETIYDYDINLFVRDAFESLGKQEQKKVMLNLTESYNYVLNEKKDDEYHQRIREQMIYYIGRIPNNEHSTITTLKQAYARESNSILKRAAAVSLILLGVEEIETDYLEKVIGDTEVDLENRSIQLIYFGDAQGDFHTYKDNGLISWDITRKAILKRLKSNSQRDINLRLWDLVTLFSFYKSRKYNPNIKNDIEVIRATLIDSCGISRQRKAILEKTKRALLLYLDNLLYEV